MSLVPSESLAVVFVTNRSGYLDQQSLYDASAGLLALARGRPATPVTGSATEVAVLGGALLLGLVAAWLLSRRRRWAVGLGAVLVVVLVAAPAVLARLSGVTLAQTLLWAPTLVVALVASGVMAAAVAAITRLVQRRTAPGTATAG